MPVMDAGWTDGETRDKPRKVRVVGEIGWENGTWGALKQRFHASESQAALPQKTPTLFDHARTRNAQRSLSRSDT
eukprot:967780-Rhodomonas_salina.6